MRSSIRKRLTLAFIGLSIGPLLLVGIILAWQSFITQKQQALNLQREVAQHVAFQVKAFLDGLENELHLVNQVQGLQKLDPDKQRNILAELLSYEDAFESLVLLDSQGREQARVARSSVSLIKPDTRATLDEFVIPRTTGQTYYSPVYFDETTGEPSITMAMPLYDIRTGQVNGVLVAEVRLEQIWDLIMNLQTGPGQSVYIVDAENKVVAHRNPSVVLRGTTFQVPDHDGIQPGLASVSPMSAMDMHPALSIRSLVTRLTSPNVVLAVDTVRFGEQEFNVIAEQTVAEALALAITTILVTGSLIVAALAMSIALGVVIVRQVVQPIQAMAATAQAISAGDLSRKVQVTSRDEVGVLAAAFNSMTAQLQQSLESLKQQVVEVKQAEESLRRANETLQALIDYSPLAIIMLDPDGHVLLWNNAAEKMYGWTAQEVLGEFIPFVLEDKREELQAIRERVNTGEIITNLESERRRKDGSRILTSVSMAPLRDSTGNVYAEMCIATDITERKKAEGALRESEERLRQITSSLREVIWLRDLQTRQVLYVNPAFEKLTGRSCESVYQNKDTVIDICHPDDREGIIKALDQRIEGVFYDKEHRIIHMDGSVRWVSSRSFPVRNEAGEVYRWASIMEDITERKQAQMEREALIASLEAKNAELERFTYTVSHDLKTPLITIRGFVGYIEQDAQSGDMHRMRGDLQRIATAADRMQDLLNDLLELSRIGRLMNPPEDVPLGNLVRDAAKLMENRLQERNIEIKIQENLPVVFGDAERWSEVIQNLLDNAVKFMGEQTKPVIEIGTAGEENGLPVCYVRDNGIGISPKYHERIFGLFNKLNPNVEGTGVGLAIVKRIVEVHGGRIWVESEEGQGATFYFTFERGTQSERR